MAIATPMKAKPPADYSLVEVQMKSGDIIGITMKVSPAYAGVLPSSLRDGFLTLHNEREGIVLRAKDIVAVRITKITTE